jgi:tetratricopeptide (TPR) repeat protein
LNRLVLLLLCAGLGACATPPPLLPPAVFFHDGLFAAPAERIDASDVFALSEAMKHYVHFDIAHELRIEGRARGLIIALYRHDRLMLDYDSATTRNAAQAFDARKGNCLSLLIMTAAFAKELGLQVNYQAVATEETWSRSDDLLFLNTHVNLTLAKRVIDYAPGHDPDLVVGVDFLPSERLMAPRTRSISEDTVVAMYMNNRAAEALASGQIDEAYWWTRAAIAQAPDFLAPYNTLAVVYLRHGYPQAAEEVLSSVVQRDPQDRKVMSNLLVALDKLGRTEEASALREKLARMEPYPPYHFFWLGTAAMERGDFQAAKSLFEREVRRADYCSEFHFWLGLANLRLGDLEGAQKQLAIALENSTTTTDHDLYAGQLARLRSYGAH